VADMSGSDLKAVVDACTLCDMCFMTKCPYVPPHEYDLDFPHLMLRYRAVEHRKGETSFADTQLAEMGRNGKLGTMLAGAANWATKPENSLTRPIMEAALGIDTRAHLPPFLDTPFTKQAPALIPAPNRAGPAYGRKVAIYAGCHDEFNDNAPGLAAMKVFAHQGVALRVEHPDCCGMPKFENGDLPAVANAAQRISAHFAALIDDGYDIVELTTSCALMLKFEWPLIEPEKRQCRQTEPPYIRCVGIYGASGQGCGLGPDRGHAAIHRRALCLPCTRPEHGPESHGNAASHPRSATASH